MLAYTEDQIKELYLSSLQAAKRNLRRLPVYCGNEPNFLGLNGWIFEQTIQHCVRKEFAARKIAVEIIEQAKLKARVKADLRINNVAIEIKQSGLFAASDIAKYEGYMHAAHDIGLEYLYITGDEGYQPYRQGITHVLGKNNAFFLDTTGDWKRFIHRLLRLVK